MEQTEQEWLAGLKVGDEVLYTLGGDPARIKFNITTGKICEVSSRIITVGYYWKFSRKTGKEHNGQARLLMPTQESFAEFAEEWSRNLQEAPDAS